MHYFAPHSLALAPKSNSTYAAHFANFNGLISSFPFTVKEIIDNPASNQILIWATASPVWVPEVTGSVGEVEGSGEDGRDEEDDWTYTGEYMFLLSFEDGETGDDGEGGKLKRIERIVEFLDSKGTMRLIGLMQKAKENLERLKKENKMDV